VRSTVVAALVGMMIAPVWLVASPLRALRDLPADVPG
jgi:hypothetical protein